MVPSHVRGFDHGMHLSRGCGQAGYNAASGYWLQQQRSCPDSCCNLTTPARKHHHTLSAAAHIPLQDILNSPHLSYQDAKDQLAVLSKSKLHEDLAVKVRSSSRGAGCGWILFHSEVLTAVRGQGVAAQG